jgi:hypothetical protein
MLRAVAPRGGVRRRWDMMNTTEESIGAVAPILYLDEATFCARYNIRPRTAQRWRLTGDGPAFVRLGPRRIGYRSTDCERWAAERTFAHRADELSQQAAA